MMQKNIPASTPRGGGIKLAFCLSPVSLHYKRLYVLQRDFKSVSSGVQQTTDKNGPSYSPCLCSLSHLFLPPEMWANLVTCSEPKEYGSRDSVTDLSLGSRRPVHFGFSLVCQRPLRPACRRITDCRRETGCLS